MPFAWEVSVLLTRFLFASSVRLLYLQGTYCVIIVLKATIKKLRINKDNNAILKIRGIDVKTPGDL